MNVAYIPVRGGSKSIPLKNIKVIAGHPLVYWVAKAASDCKYIDKVYVATDDERIKTIVDGLKLNKIVTIGRSKESASDTASTEMAMLEFANMVDFDNLVLIQATSPLLTSDDLNGGFGLFDSKGTDSVLSVVRQKRFCWKKEDNGNVNPVNYDYQHRPRRQEFEGFLVENGAFYITSKERLIKSRNRISGNIKAYEMDEASYFEIDEESDWIVVEHLLRLRNGIENKKANIKLFLTDCDGCLTDGGMYYSESGDELKKFNTKDGMAFKILRQQGILTGIITGEGVELNRRRAQKLNMDIIELGCKDKLSAVRRICDERNIDISQVAYVGDDINDIELLKAVGYSCAPADAVEEVKKAVKFVTSTNGGCGVIREIVDRLVL